MALLDTSGRWLLMSTPVLRSGRAAVSAVEDDAAAFPLDLFVEGLVKLFLLLLGSLEETMPPPRSDDPEVCAIRQVEQSPEYSARVEADLVGEDEVIFIRSWLNRRLGQDRIVNRRDVEARQDSMEYRDARHEQEPHQQVDVKHRHIADAWQHRRQDKPERHHCKNQAEVNTKPARNVARVQGPRAQHETAEDQHHQCHVEQIVLGMPHHLYFRQQ
mmetsp:Transcript_96243/g.272482  ORF Transcript_96243/g.272482 Transcript_96243/m.272482 type:complete len:216 (+) Transcript_96243:106-753(+)